MNLVPALASIVLLSSFTQAMNLTSEIRSSLADSAPRRSADTASTEQDLGLTDANEPMTVSLMLRRPRADEFTHLVGALESKNQFAHTMNHDELASRYGAEASDIQLVTQFAQTHALKVDRIEAAARMVVLSGTAGQMNAAFSVALHNYNHPRGRYHSHTSNVQLPIALNGVVTDVIGLDNRVNYAPYLQLAQTRRKPKPTPNPDPTNPDPTNPDPTQPTQPIPPDEAAAIKNSFTALQVAKIYNFPQGTGAGQCIAIIELGGGYNEADLKKYFSLVGLSEPSVQSVSVDGATNSPTGKPDSADGEVALDIEVAGSVAPSANLVVYFAPQGTDQGFLHAISSAVHDQKNHCSTISISWGGPESKASASFINQADQLLQDAAAAGITVTVASGDQGASDGLPGNKATADFPSSSPHVLACGGTSLKAQNNSITSEVAWNLLSIKKGATGGGISKKFPVPDYQNGLSVTTASGASALTGRGVPDVAGDAAPDTGYKMIVDGEETISGGTSAVAPLYAGLFAVINGNRNSNVGFANATLYAHPEAFHVITNGNNGLYMTSTSGWSAVTGLGSPDGQKIQDSFGK